MKDADFRRAEFVYWSRRLVKDIVHQQDIAPGHPGAFGNLEGAQHIASPRSGGRHGALAGGGAATHQRGGVQGDAGAARKRPGVLS